MKTKKRKVALYDPYLNTLGGGEKHILSIIKVLEDSDFEAHIFWDKNLSSDIFNKLGINFENLIFEKNIFKHKNIIKNALKLSQYEYFFYVTDGSYFLSCSKNNFVFCMVPDKNLYNMNFLNKFKTANFKFITNSEFTQKWLSNWQIKSDVIYPFLEKDYFSLNERKKDKLILNVGRFFRSLHSKRQDVALSWFKDLKEKKPVFKDYKLILAGGVLKEDEEYLNELKGMAKNDNQIEFHTNISYTEIFELYNKSEFYWHFTGFGIDENINPEKTEHLGITPIEAMSRGCLTFAYEAGGPKEILKDNENGFLFKNQDELFSKMERSFEIKENIRSNAIKYAREKFSYEKFKERVKKVILYK